MTIYHGGKNRTGKEIAEVIYDYSMDISDKEDFIIKGYCEPFCGMLGVYRHIPALFKDHKPKLKYKAGDYNKSVVLMWKAAQKGWIPPINCSEKHYNELKYDGKDSAEKGFLGHQLGFGGQYFQAYALNYGRDIKILYGASDRVSEIAQDLSFVNFSSGDYTQFSGLKGYVIYCDPPYSQTTQRYKNTFDTKKFWDWCEDMAQNNILFISEYKAPKGIKKIWTKKVKTTGYAGANMKTSDEKLFVI